MSNQKPKFSLVLLAAMCHETNRLFCIAHNDNSHKHWEDCTAEEKAISINAIQELLLTLDFSGSNEVLGEATWRAWAKQKLAQGWKYGPIKNTRTKEHPCLIANYEALPEFEKVKDYLYISTIRTISTTYEVTPC